MSTRSYEQNIRRESFEALDQSLSNARPICIDNKARYGQSRNITMGLCSSCHWCYTSISKKGHYKICPKCAGMITESEMEYEKFCVLKR